MPMMMAAMATAMPITHPAQPIKGIHETTSVIPIRTQLTRPSTPDPLRGGWTMEAFGRIGVGAGVRDTTGLGGGRGAGVTAAAGAGAGRIVIPGTPERGAQPAVPSNHARSVPTKVPSASLLLTSSRVNGP